MLDERSVELDDVERYLTQVAQGGVAGSEVVDRDSDAQLSQPLQVQPGGLVIAQEQALGDL